MYNSFGSRQELSTAAVAKPIGDFKAVFDAISDEVGDLANPLEIKVKIANLVTQDETDGGHKLIDDSQKALDDVQKALDYVQN